MTNSYLTNIHTRKIITENVIFKICTCHNMDNKKKKNMPIDQLMTALTRLMKIHLGLLKPLLQRRFKFCYSHHGSCLI